LISLKNARLTSENNLVRWLRLDYVISSAKIIEHKIVMRDDVGGG
jgi:hypothetical protein